jgi:hypothetical protein
MNNRIYGFDVMRYGGRTTITVWRDLPNGKVRHHSYAVKSKDRYERMWELFGNIKLGVWSVHPDTDSLTVSLGVVK